MRILRSPCLMCPHHLAGGDKNEFRCGTCPERQSYVVHSHGDIYTRGDYGEFSMIINVPSTHFEVHKAE